jgi:hypothetical protein
MNRKFELALHPTPQPGRVDTSLRYTDILFGFVIKELFTRLQNWPTLDGEIRWHLIAGTTLVLGSWIGYRRSLNRTTYEVKFFNLPFFRFLADQLMLILYFRIAVLSDAQGKMASDLATDTAHLIAGVFALYVLWDVLGIWMAKARLADVPTGRSEYRYPRLHEGCMTTEKQAVDRMGFFITLFTFAVTATLGLAAQRLIPEVIFMLEVLCLIAYRLAKEVRTSWRSP